MIDFTSQLLVLIIVAVAEAESIRIEASSERYARTVRLQTRQPRISRAARALTHRHVHIVDKERAERQGLILVCVRNGGVCLERVYGHGDVPRRVELVRARAADGQRGRIVHRIVDEHVKVAGLVGVELHGAEHVSARVEALQTLDLQVEHVLRYRERDLVVLVEALEEVAQVAIASVRAHVPLEDVGGGSRALRLALQVHAVVGLAEARLGRVHVALAHL